MSAEQIPDNVKEVVERLTAVGPIGKILTRYLQWMIQPDEVILLAYPQLQMGEDEAESFGSLDLKMLTNQRFLTLGLYPTYHSFDVKDVHKIAHFNLNSRFSTGYEGEGEVTTAEERNFQPREIEVEVRFEDEFGKEVFVWNQDASRAEDIKTLFQFVPILSRISGKALREQRG